MQTYTVSGLSYDNRGLRRKIRARDANEAKAKMRRLNPGCYWLIAVKQDVGG